MQYPVSLVREGFKNSGIVLSFPKRTGERKMLR